MWPCWIKWIMPQSHRPGTQSTTTSYEVENKGSDELWKVHVTQANRLSSDALVTTCCQGKMYISQVVAKNLIVITLFTCILVVVWIESMELRLQAVVYWESLIQTGTVAPFQTYWQELLLWRGTLNHTFWSFNTTWLAVSKYLQITVKE